jgi:hypothetical protein
MRLIFVTLLTLSLALTGPACSEEEGAEEGAAAAEEGAEGAEKPADEKAEGEEGEKSADEKAGDEKAEGDKPGDEKAAAAPEGDAPAAESKPLVSEDECKAACAHITTLTMASLPAETKEEAKAKIKEALGERCPIDCLKHGTPEAIKCATVAKTAIDLASCPK